MAKAVEVNNIEVQMDSQLVTKQFSGEFEILSPSMKRYAQQLKKVSAEFEQFQITKIDRTVNGKADTLARLASASRAVDLRKIVLLGRDKSILEESGHDMLNIEVGDNWMSEILNWLGNEVLPEDQVKARVVQKRALNFYLNHGVLYKRGFAGPDLRCVQ